MTTTTLQNWTEDGEIYTRLIDESGRITEWGPDGMLCREGCGEPAGLGTGGQCLICAGLAEPERTSR